MIAFVTGGTGFVGSYLLRYLVNDGRYTSVRAIRRASSPMDLVADIADKISWYEGDILDVFSLEEAMQGATHVYHVAAFISFQPEDHKKMLKINVEGTENVVNTALYCDVQKLGYVSSIAALGRTSDRRFFDEQTKWQNDPLNSAYAISKFHAEQHVWRGEAEGLPVVIVNPSIILGSSFWHSGSPALFGQVAKGLKFYPLGATGYVDVRDVAALLHRLVHSSIASERFILNSENWSFRRFFDTAADALTVARPTIAVHRWLGEVAWCVEWLRSKLLRKKTIITRETIHSSLHNFEYSNQKIRAAFPDFTFIAIDKTIEETAKAYKNGGISLLKIG